MKFKGTLFLSFLLIAPVILNATGQNAAGVSSPDYGWERVKQIPQQQKITVHLQYGTKINGRFVEADDTQIVLSEAKGKTEKIAKAEVRRISRKSRSRGALLGLGIGVGTGVAVGASKSITGESDISRGASASIGGMMFGFFGTVIGGVIGIPQTIYESPTSKVEGYEGLAAVVQSSLR